MDATAAEFAIKSLLTEIRQKLETATATAKAAEACAVATSYDQAARIVLDIEQPMYEAGRLLDAASLINRLSREGSGDNG
ncbi:MAG: hypothetical protein NTZ72_19145 [Afipia sp.]|nr:hypothetical protein [Afipia sp.]